MIEKQKNPINVPMTPNNRMLVILEKKSPLYILNPDANTIGGRQTKKNILSLNLIISMKV